MYAYRLWPIATLNFLHSDKVSIMSKSIFQVFIIMAIGLFASCKPNDKVPDPTIVCEAGEGGNINIVAFPKHHSQSVRPYEAWIKYNTQDVPGPTSASYDLIRSADTTQDHILLSNLKCGAYYIYMRGYDTAIQEEVVGGIPIKLAEGTTGNVEIVVPVSE